MPSGESLRVGIRVNFDLEEELPEQIGYQEDGTRFGFSYESGALRSAIDRISKIPHVVLTGLHMHSTSITRSLDVYIHLARAAVRIAREFDLKLGYVDIGGGFFGGLPEKPSYFEYVEAISEELEKEFEKNCVSLIIEPGSSVIASPISFVSSVTDVRDFKKARHIQIDGSRNNVDPLRIKANYFFQLELRMGRL